MDETTPLTFENDKLGLQPFCNQFERFLITEHEFVEGGLVVSLKAPFGTGKTTFLRMWAGDLNRRRKENHDLPQAIILNAWESDFCGDPLLSVVSGLTKSAYVDSQNQTPSAAGRLREAAKDVAWFAAGLANDVAAKWAGVNPIAAAKLAESKKEERSETKPDFLNLFEQRIDALAQLKATLKEAFGGSSPKALIFVDELDRCRPDYAISYLEAIKHVFDVHGLVFVLAVDYDQLACSARALFGNDLNFPEYLRKFVHRSVSLPAPDRSMLEGLANHYVQTYLEKPGSRLSMMNLEHRAKQIAELSAALKINPRQLQEMFRIIGHVVAGDADGRGRLLWGIGIGVIFMSALHVANPRLYHRIGTGQQSHEEVGKYLMSLLGAEDASWWIRVYLTGAYKAEDRDDERVIRFFEELGLRKKGEPFDRRRVLGDFAAGWGHGSAFTLQTIYKRIERTAEFSSQV